METKSPRKILKLASKALPETVLPDLLENARESELFEILKERLRYLLDHDFGGLLQGLYRMDVDEARVKEILSVTQPDNMATELALLMWHRAAQKLETRKKYGSGESN